MAEYSKRQCPVWEKGKYKLTEKPKNKKDKKKDDEEAKKKMTSPEEYFGSTEDHLKARRANN